MFPRNDVHDMKISRPAIIGFEDAARYGVESVADEGVEHEHDRRIVRKRPIQHVSGDAVHVLRPQPGPRPFYIALGAFRELIIDLHADHAPEGQLPGDEEGLPLSGAKVDEDVCGARIEILERAPHRQPPGIVIVEIVASGRGKGVICIDDPVCRYAQHAIEYALLYVFHSACPGECDLAKRPVHLN